MATKQITQEDILRQKIEITEEQSRLRHEQASNFQDVLLRMEESMDKKIDKLIDSFQALEKRMEERFAPKWVEKFAIFILATVGVSII